MFYSTDCPESESTRGTSLSKRDSKLSHEIEASGQPVHDGVQTLKSHSIQKVANIMHSPNAERNQ